MIEQIEVIPDAPAIDESVQLPPEIEISVEEKSDGAGAFPVAPTLQGKDLSEFIGPIGTPTEHGPIYDFRAEPQQALRQIAICGFAESSRDMANKLDKDVEIWSLNRCYTFLKRWDRWYEVHEEELFTGRTGLREAGYVDMLKESKVPIYMMHPDPDIPMARQFPMDEIVASGLRKYFTTSISYMLAHAVFEHDQGHRIKEIFMYGIDMSAFSEYSYQRPSVEYWCGVAEGRGIKVTIPDVSPVLKGPLYGDSSSKALRDVMSERIQGHKSTKAQLAADLQGGSGALYELTHYWPELRMSPIYKVRFKDREKDLNQLINQATADLNSAMGQEREAQHWLSYVGANQREEDEPDSVQLPHEH